MMNAKTRLGYMALGAAIGISGLAIGLCVSPLKAQRETFGEITCTGLKVVNSYGTEVVGLGADSLWRACQHFG